MWLEKILILARESGVTINLEDITNTSFLTQNNLNADTVSDFYASLFLMKLIFKTCLMMQNLKTVN